MDNYLTIPTALAILTKRGISLSGNPKAAAASLRRCCVKSAAGVYQPGQAGYVQAERIGGVVWMIAPESLEKFEKPLHGKVKGWNKETASVAAESEG